MSLSPRRSFTGSRKRKPNRSQSLHQVLKMQCFFESANWADSIAAARNTSRCCAGAPALRPSCGKVSSAAGPHSDFPSGRIAGYGPVDEDELHESVRSVKSTPNNRKWRCTCADLGACIHAGRSRRRLAVKQRAENNARFRLVAKRRRNGGRLALRMAKYRIFYLLMMACHRGQGDRVSYGQPDMEL